MKKFFQFGKGKKESSESSASKRGSISSRQGSVVSLSSASQTLGGYEVREKDLGKLHKAVWRGDVDKIQSLVKKENINALDKGKRTALHLACAAGLEAVVSELLAWRANVNIGDGEAKTPLLKAVENNHVGCSQLLINGKANVKVKDREGNSVLHYAARGGNHDLMTLLLKYFTRGDPELNAKNNKGLTALHVAVMNHHDIICSDLLESDADIDTPDLSGNTPLMLACHFGHSDTVDLLLEYEADANIKNKEGWTADDIAQKKGHVECRTIIARYLGQEPDAENGADNGESGNDEDGEEDDDGDQTNSQQGAAAAAASKPTMAAEAGKTSGPSDETAEVDSWHDSDTEQSEQVKQALPLNNLSKAKAVDSEYVNDAAAGPGYETIDYINNVRSASNTKDSNAAAVNSWSSSLPVQSAGGAAVTAAAAGKQTVNELPVPQSARSTLSGGSWVDDSKWSDEEEPEQTAQPFSLQYGAIPKTSAGGGAAAANSSTSNNNSNTKNAGTDAEKPNNATVVEQKRGAVKQTNLASSKDRTRQMKADLGLDDSLDADDSEAISSMKLDDTAARKPPDSARSVQSDWDSSVADSEPVVKQPSSASGNLGSKGAPLPTKPMAGISEKQEVDDDKWDSDDDDVDNIPTLPESQVYADSNQSSVPSKPPPVHQPHAFQQDEDEKLESEEESTWETERKLSKAKQAELTTSEAANLAKSGSARTLTGLGGADRNPSPAPSTHSLQGGPVSLSTDVSNVMKLQEQLRDRQSKLDDERNQRLSVENKCKSLESDRELLQQKLDKVTNEKMAAEKSKIDLEAKLRNLQYQLQEDSQRRENAELLCEKLKDQTIKKDEQIKQLTELKVKLELSISNMEKEKLATASSSKQVAVNDVKKAPIVEQQSELYAAKLDLERQKELHRDEIDQLQFEIEELKKQNTEMQTKLTCGEDALTQANISGSLQFTSLKGENDRLATTLTKEKTENSKLDAMLKSLRSQLSTVETELRAEKDARRELERQSQYQAEQWRRTLEQREEDLTRIQSSSQNQSEQVIELHSKVSRLEAELSIANTNLMERTSQLESIQKSLEQKRTSYEALDETLRKEKETTIRLTMKIESLEEKLTTAMQESQRLKEGSDSGKGGSSSKLESLISDLREERNKAKIEMQQKNGALADALAQAKDELRNSERDRASLEDEKRRLQTQLTNSQRQIATTEASVEAANQAKQQLQTEIQQLRKQIDSLKDKLDDERKRASMSESKVAELSDRLRNSENIAATASDRLNQESSTLVSISKSKRELEESLHRMELEKTKLEVALDGERQKVALLQRDYNDARQAQKAAVDDLAKIKTNNAQLQCLMNESATLRQQAQREVDDNRALWENEIKSRSKLGLRIAQLEREKQEAINLLNEEKRRAKKATEAKRSLELKLEQEEQRSTHLEREVVTLRTHLKAAKKRLKLDDARLQLHQDLGGPSGPFFASTADLTTHAVAPSTSMVTGDALGQNGLSAYKMNVSGNYAEKPDLQRLKAELEARAQKEFEDKLEEVNAYLVEQSRAREQIDRLRDNNEMEIRKEFERMKRDLLEEVSRLKSGQPANRDPLPLSKDTINQQTKDSQQQLRALSENEAKLRQRLSARLDQASERVDRAQTMRFVLPDSDVTGHGVYRKMLTEHDSYDSIRSQLDKSISRHLDVSGSGAQSQSALTVVDLNSSLQPTATTGVVDSGLATNDYTSPLQRNFLL